MKAIIETRTEIISVIGGIFHTKVKDKKVRQKRQKSPNHIEG